MSLSLFASLSFSSVPRSLSLGRSALHLQSSSLHRSFSAFSRFIHSPIQHRTHPIFTFQRFRSVASTRSHSNGKYSQSTIFTRSFSSFPPSSSSSSLSSELPSPHPISSTLSFRRSPLQCLKLGIAELLCFVVALVAGHVAFIVVLRFVSEVPLGLDGISPVSEASRRFMLAGQTATNLLAFTIALLIAWRRKLPQMRQAADQALSRVPSGLFLRFLYLSACTASVLASVPLFTKIFKLKASEDSIISRFIFTLDPFVMLFCSVVAPITEELLFRRLLFARLVVQIGTLPAILFTSLAFGIIHSSSTSDKVIPAIFGGFFMSLAYRYTGVLSVPILIHIINNAIAAGILGVASPFNEFFDDNMQSLAFSMLFGTVLPEQRSRVPRVLTPLDCQAVFQALDTEQRGYLTDREMFYLLSLTPHFCSFVEPVLLAILDGRHSSLDRLDGQQSVQLQVKPKVNLKKSEAGELQLSGDAELKLTTTQLKSKAQRTEEGMKAWQYFSRVYSFADLQPAMDQMLKQNTKLSELAEKAKADDSAFPSRISPLLSAIHSLPERDRDYFVSRWLSRCVEGYLEQFSPRSSFMVEARLRPWNSNIDEEVKKVTSDIQRQARRALQDEGIPSTSSGQTEMLETIKTIEMPDSLLRPRYYRMDVDKILGRLSNDQVTYDKFVNNLVLVASGAKQHPFDFGAIDKSTGTASFVSPANWSDGFSKKKSS